MNYGRPESEIKSAIWIFMKLRSILVSAKPGFSFENRSHLLNYVLPAQVLENSLLIWQIG